MLNYYSIKKLPDYYVLTSLDVVSLFNNEHLDAALISMGLVVIAQTDTTYVDMVKFLFDNTYFTFNNKFYKQIFGTSVRATISPILATYVLDDL